MGVNYSGYRNRRVVHDVSNNIPKKMDVEEPEKIEDPFAKLEKEYEKKTKVEGEDFLGKGSYGRVWKTYYEGKNRAVKTIRTAVMDDARRQCLKTEIYVSKICKHSNIVDFISHYSDNELKIVHLIMEELDMTVMAYVESVGISHNLLKRLSFEFFSGLSYLHKKNIIHRDVNPNNLAMKGETLKIIDFGSAWIQKKSNLLPRAGTLVFTAPEVFILPKYNNKIDVWSFGYTLALLAANNKDNNQEWFKSGNPGDHLTQIFRYKGKPPRCFQNIFEKTKEYYQSESWNAYEPMDLKIMFPNERWHENLICQDQETDELRTFIGNLFTLDPKNRPSAKAAIQQTYIQTLFHKEEQVVNNGGSANGNCHEVEAE